MRWALHIPAGRVVGTGLGEAMAGDRARGERRIRGRQIGSLAGEASAIAARRMSAKWRVI
jgi:hypothetical protein